MIMKFIYTSIGSGDPSGGIVSATSDLLSSDKVSYHMDSRFIRIDIGVNQLQRNADYIWFCRWECGKQGEIKMLEGTKPIMIGWHFNSITKNNHTAGFIQVWTLKF